MAESFSRVGLFHFAQNHVDPIGSLKDALSRHSYSDISNTLIVLPEAFNYGRVYDEGCQPLIEADEVLEDLCKIAHEHEIAFVVGLLKPRNSAYFVNGGCSRLMGHKGVPNRIEPDDAHNPIEINDTVIGVRICRDAHYFYQLMTKKVEESTCTRKIICIPASMSPGSFDSPTVAIRAYQNMYVILANARPHLDGCGSFVANRNGRKVGGCNFKGEHNAIRLRTWGELDGLDA